MILVLRQDGLYVVLSIISSHEPITCYTSFSSRSDAFAEALASKRASKEFPRQVYERVVV